jgi:hypothetical protein
MNIPSSLLLLIISRSLSVLKENLLGTSQDIMPFLMLQLLILIMLWFQEQIMEVYISGIGKVDIISSRLIVSHSLDLYLQRLLFSILFSIDLDLGIIIALILLL